MLEPDSDHQLTHFLRAWSGGDSNAFAKLVNRVYPELRKIAGGCLSGERPGHTLQATALVHEAYLKLVDIRQVRWQDRAHFFAMAARIMRRILIDHARVNGRAKRGGGRRRTNFTEALTVSANLDSDILRLDEALQELAKFDARKAEVVEMRYFAGLTSNEIASVLKVSPRSVDRDWSLAKAWLVREMSREHQYGRPALGSN